MSEGTTESLLIQGYRSAQQLMDRYRHTPMSPPSNCSHPPWSGLIRWITGLVLALIVVTTSAPSAKAEGPVDLNGAELFSLHCAGCHLNGGNIIRRGKNLKLATLERRGLDSVEAIARIARDGAGQMSGYGDVLNEGGDLVVASWVLEQAQKAWIQG